MVGLSRHDFSGPVLGRRAVLRLLAASGVLTAAHLMPGVGVMPARAAAGGTLRAGWAAVGEFRTIDPAQINQVLLFQIASNVLSGLTHINPQLQAEGDLAVDWTVDDTGTQYTFNLREGVTFHNGDVVHRRRCPLHLRAVPGSGQIDPFARGRQRRRHREAGRPQDPDFPQGAAGIVPG